MGRCAREKHSAIAPRGQDRFVAKEPVQRAVFHTQRQNPATLAGIIKQQINGEITKGVWLEGKIDELSVQNLLLTTGFLVVDVRLSGKLKLKID